MCYNGLMLFFPIIIISIQVLALVGLTAMCTFSSHSLLRIETDLSGKGKRRDSYEEVATEDDDEDDDDDEDFGLRCGAKSTKEPAVDDAEREIMKRMTLGFESGEVQDGSCIEHGQQSLIVVEAGALLEAVVDVESGGIAGEEAENMCP